MSLVIAALVTLSSVGIYLFMNRDKPIKYVLSGMLHSLETQGAGAAGLVDDWWNRRRNKVDIPDKGGRVAVVTGGARGIGKEIVRALLQAKMTVIVGVRNVEAAKQMAKEMKNGEKLHAFPLDLQSLKSVETFSKIVLQEYASINLLVCNAGVMFGDYKLTEDGFENQLATNHLGHFYLTHLLLPALKRGGSAEEVARVVNVTSCAHHPGKIYFEDVNMNKHYDPNAAYSQSKLAQILSARHINKLMEEEGSHVRCFSVHPGIVNTELFDGTWFKSILPWAMNIFFKTPEQGAISILYACFNNDIKGGLYISNCREGISNSFSKKVENMVKMYEISCQLVKIDSKRFGGYSSF